MRNPSRLRWSLWRKIADQWLWYTRGLTYDGPSCYELGTATGRRPVTSRYVGGTECERARIASYAKHGSHLREVIAEHLRAGDSLYFRRIMCASKVEADALQDVLLARKAYAWNSSGISSGLRYVL